jgi:hypothetical protein
MLRDCHIFPAADVLRHCNCCWCQQAASASQRAAAGGKLDAALSHLSKTIDTAAAAAGTGSRVEHMELIIAHLQAARVLMQRQQKQQQQQQQQGAGEAAVAAAAAGLSGSSLRDGGVEEVQQQLLALAKLLNVEASSR